MNVNVARLQRELGVKADGIVGPNTRRVVAAYQRDHGLKADGIPGPVTLGHAAEHFGWHVVLPPTNDNLMAHCFAATIGKESGGRPDAAFCDGEFRSLPDHWAYQKTHIGLSLGKTQVTQEGGALGMAMQLVPHAVRLRHGIDDRVMEILTASGPTLLTDDGYRNARVQPLDGADFWEQPWLDRFKAVARTPEWETAILTLALTQFLKPMLRYARLHTAREYAVLFDMANANGVAGARRRLPAAWSSERELVDGAFRLDKSRKRRYDVIKNTAMWVRYEG